MRGHYNMFNFNSSEKFKVLIPTFKFSAPFALN
jgi:ApaG protein